ncbi:gluconeogenesis factor YvcK family protein [Candidatus Oscillochloris fontis]|uniref:gluconeogenesis factor YvcK family protein n=1 Tax=Candidatus Oscillochloris fontis TaxID=2496868 RepID=UPI00101D7651|nr:gluconeogenesis factor YvcK family protein [Candidatus Oscillochloris fontis]
MAALPTALTLTAIGGGGGTAQILLGAAPFFPQRRAIVAVTDTGRSTGVARSLGKIPAPGDLRATISALATDPAALWPRLLELRFHSAEHPALNGMAFGNLFITALTQLHGDFAQAVQQVADLVQPSATVLPVAVADVQLCAELADGTLRHGELDVRGLHKPSITRLFLDPPAPASAVALEAIQHADLVTIGPGSFFTSILATLQFEGMIAALRTTPARVVYICNSTTQSGQTEGMSAYDHVARLHEILGVGHLDAALINHSPQPPTDLVARLAADGLQILSPTTAEIAAIAALGVTPLVDDFSEPPGAVRQLWNKQDTLRYNAAHVGATLFEYVRTSTTTI